MNDYLEFLILFPSIMWLVGHFLFGPEWFRPNK